MNYEELLNDAYDKVEINLETKTSRFEIPKVKGHHIKTKTIISNFLQITAQIRRNPTHLLKFLTKELASQGEMQNERLILSRKLSSKEINEKINKYVGLFVLCPKCKKPDTEIIEKNGENFIHCLACGEKNQIHKL